MAGVRKRANRSGKFQGWFVDVAGKLNFFTGVRDRRETLRMAERLEDEHRQVRLGYREPPKSASKAKTRPYAEAVKEYLTWGAAQGGRRGYGWAARHVHYRKSNLEWWAERLSLRTLGDLDGILPKAEQALIELGKTGLAPKTLRNTAESIKAFCKWAEDRNYLDGNPVKRLGGFSSDPQSQKRLFTSDELRAILDVTPSGRKLFYQTGLCTGLRVSELRALRVSDLNLAGQCLNIRPEASKSRRPAMQPIPARLRELLSEQAAGLDPDAALLDAPGSPQDAFNDDLKHAGIAKFIPGQGVACLHGLRVFFITALDEAGATQREAQVLARHSTGTLTLNVYTKARPERLHALVEQVGKRVFSLEKLATSLLPKAACLASGESEKGFMVGDAGFEPATSTV